MRQETKVRMILDSSSATIGNGDLFNKDVRVTPHLVTRDIT